MKPTSLWKKSLGGLAALVAFALLPHHTAAQTPSSALLVLDKEDNMLSIVDPATLKTVARVPTGEGPYEIAVSDDGKFAFVAITARALQAIRFR